jgi:hypothetical protein
VLARHFHRQTSSRCHVATVNPAIYRIINAIFCTNLEVCSQITALHGVLLRRPPEMGWSKSTRISVMIGLDTIFLIVELGIGYWVNSLALIADAFHMVCSIASFNKAETFAIGH